MSLPLLPIGIVIAAMLCFGLRWWWTSYTLAKQDVATRTEELGKAVNRWKLAESREENLKQELRRAQEAFDFLLQHVNEWRLVGEGEVRKAAAYPEEPAIPFPANFKHAFDPIPECRKPVEEAAVADKEKVYLFTDDPTDEADNFTVFVFNPKDAGQHGNSAFIARIVVTTTIGSNRYTIDVYNDGQQHRSRGGNSLAMDYVLKRAKKHGIEALNGQLIHFTEERDRIRLYCFYGHKYGFTYEPSTNTITKQVA
ncbi:hypothetical protein [Hymenobacter sp. AT01-02]|uniref:hypothetical protein n=1 Tax=Hymenobacter sp. AT01-02 TaxID=1571877 RepID=UPI0005F22B21|nr:hypothetical protein [Hymenobacter sp. AT01-02]